VLVRHVDNDKLKTLLGEEERDVEDLFIVGGMTVRDCVCVCVRTCMYTCVRT
jgi:hypothetical protein